MKIIELVLNKYGITNQDLLQELVIQNIPAGFIGNIRGNLFNDYVKQYIMNINFFKHNSHYAIMFEKTVNIENIDEIPDWYIYNLQTKQYLIGMNQLDFWSGGHQSNRCSKYLNFKNTNSCKLVSVILNFKCFKKHTSKTCLLLNGFVNNKVCYLTNLENIIFDFFNIDWKLT